jgi:hypothetical protein
MSWMLIECDQKKRNEPKKILKSSGENNAMSATPVRNCVSEPSSE